MEEISVRQQLFFEIFRRSFRSGKALAEALLSRVRSHMVSSEPPVKCFLSKAFSVISHRCSRPEDPIRCCGGRPYGRVETIRQQPFAKPSSPAPLKLRRRPKGGQRSPHDALKGGSAALIVSSQKLFSEVFSRCRPARCRAGRAGGGHMVGSLPTVNGLFPLAHASKSRTAPVRSSTAACPLDPK